MDLVSLGKYIHYPYYFKLNSDDLQEVEEIIDNLSLTSYKDFPLKKLSDGNLQKAFIGRALAQNTPMIILDEPTTYLDEENKMIDLFDFKTGTISDTDTWQSKESLYIYHFQLLFYRLLLKQSRIYRDYTVRSMHLLFTSPNRREVLTNPEGKMHDIELKESDIAKDSVNFEDLLLAVYYQITSLNFLDSNSSLNFKDINNASLADIKNFCQTLIEIYKNKAIDI